MGNCTSPQELNERKQKSIKDTVKSYHSHVACKDELKYLWNRLEDLKTCALKKAIIKWMGEKLQECPRGDKIECMKVKQFNQDFFELVKLLESGFYGSMLKTMVWCLHDKHMNISQEDIQLRLVEIYLATDITDGEVLKSINEVSAIRTFIDYWVAQDVLNFVDYLILFLLEMDDPIEERALIVGRSKKLKDFPLETVKVINEVVCKKRPDGTVKEKVHHKVTYQGIKSWKYKLKKEGNLTHNTLDKANIFLNQILEMSGTITTFLLELFLSIFDFVDLPKYRGGHVRFKEPITRYIFVKDSNLMAATLFLTKIINWECFKFFLEKCEDLKNTPDDKILNPKIMKYARTVPPTDNLFRPEELTKYKKAQIREAIGKFKMPVDTFQDMITMLKEVTATLVNMVRKDPFFLVHWVEVFDRWVHAGFTQILEADSLIEIFYVIMKYMDTEDILLYALALSKLFPRLDDTYTFSLFHNTMSHTKPHG